MNSTVFTGTRIKKSRGQAQSMTSAPFISDINHHKSQNIEEEKHENKLLITNEPIEKIVSRVKELEQENINQE